MHQRLARAQAMMFNVMVEKLNLQARNGSGFRVVNEEEMDDLVCGKMIKEEKIDETSNVQVRNFYNLNFFNQSFFFQVHHGGVIEMFLEQAEEYENGLEADSEEPRQSRASFAASGTFFNQAEDDDWWQENFGGNGLESEPIKQQQLARSPSPRNTWPQRMHLKEPKEAIEPLGQGNAQTFNSINNIPCVNSSYSNIVQTVAGGSSDDSQQFVMLRTATVRTDGCRVMEQIKQVRFLL